jgi:putative endonuclease
MPVSASADSSILSSAKGFFVYILRCADDSLYVGHTSDVDERVKVHNDGHGALWTACRRPVVLAYWENLPTEEQAVGRVDRTKAGVKEGRIFEDLHRRGDRLQFFICLRPLSR